MQDGDVLFVTGTLGDAAAGLHLLTSDNKDLVQDNNYLIDRHRLPTPRVAFAQALSTLERVTLNDISDGIANEASELATASNLTVQLSYEKLPKHPLLKQFSNEQQRTFQLFGGEDFELVGAIPQKDWNNVKQAAEKTGVKISEIGSVSYQTTGISNVFLIENGKKHVLEKGGYTHGS